MATSVDLQEPIADARDLMLHLGNQRTELAFEHDPQRLESVRDIPFARVPAGAGPGPKRAYFTNCMARLTLTGFRSFPAWIARGWADDRPIPGDFLSSDGPPTHDEDEEFAQLLIDWAPNKELQEHAHIIAPNFGRHGKTGVPRVDRLLATIVAMRHAIQQAKDFAGFDSCGAIDPQNMNAFRQLDLQHLAGLSHDDWKELPQRVWLFERADREHDLAKHGPRPLTLWGRATFLHQRARDRCEKLLAYIQGTSELSEVRWMASCFRPPCDWDVNNIDRLAALMSELREAAPRVGELIRSEQSNPVEQLSPAQKEVFDLLTNVWQKASTIKHSLKAQSGRVVELNTVQSLLGEVKDRELAESLAGRSGGYRLKSQR